MLKISRSSKSGLRYSGLVEIPTDNSWPECTAFKYLSRRSCLFHFFYSKHTSPPHPNSVNLTIWLAQYPNTWDLLVITHHGKVRGMKWIHLTSQILYHKPSALRCLPLVQDKNGNLLIIQITQNSSS